MPYNPGPSPSPNALVIQSYIAALEEWDLEAIMSRFDETLQHQILPKSLGQPPMDKATYREYFKSVMPLFEKLEVCPVELFCF